jgi:Ca2+-binding EF-hand superfamily protein
MPTTTQDRLERRFMLWDTNGDGRIDRSDWEAEALRILKSFGEDEKAPRGRAVLTSYLHMWDYLVGLAGPDTESLTLDQFGQAAHDHIVNPGDVGFSNVLRPTIRAIADLCDADGDGKISPQEFKTWIRAVGADVSTTDKVFAQIDGDGDGYLSVDELVQAVRDYHAGTLNVSLLGD